MVVKPYGSVIRTARIKLPAEAVRLMISTLLAAVNRVRCCALVAVISSLVCLSCGKSIKTAQDFHLDHAPEIVSVSALNKDGTAIDSVQINPYTSYLVTVAASDPDKDSLSYTFTSDAGTFSDLTVISGGCTAVFITGSLLGGEKVIVNVAVSDGYGSTVHQSLNVGTGKTGPTVVVSADTTNILPSGKVTLSVSANCPGIFQIKPNADGTLTEASATLDYTADMMKFSDSGSATAVVVTGPLCSEKGNFQLPAKGSSYTSSADYANGTVYDVIIVFRDGLGQTDAVECPLYVDGTAPKISSTDPVDGAANIAVTRNMYVTFDEAINPDTLGDSSLLLDNAGSVTFVSYDSGTRTACFYVSGMTHDTAYTAAISGCKDLAGNAINSESATFSFKVSPAGSVTYDANGGTGNVPYDSTVYVLGDTVTVLSSPEPSRSGYTFGGWSLSASGTATVMSFTIQSEYVTLYAIWNANNYTVTFDANGGTLSGSVSYILETFGSVYSLPTENPTRENYTFAGWYTASSGGNRIITTDTVATASNHTLYAHWKPDVSVTLNHSELGFTSITGSYTTCSLTATVTPAGSSASIDSSVSWTSSDSGVATVSSDGTVTATGAGSTTITATSNENGNFSAACTVNVTTDTSAISLDITGLDITGVASATKDTSMTWTANEYVHNVCVYYRRSQDSSASDNLNILTPDGNIDMNTSRTDIFPLTAGGDFAVEMHLADSGGRDFKTETLYVTTPSESDSNAVTFNIISSYTGLSSLLGSTGSTVLAAHYLLTKDIDCNDAAISSAIIGRCPFTGVFNGNMHTIKNWSISSDTVSYLGLFSYMDGATVQNLYLSGASVSLTSSYSNYAGTLAGWADSSIISHCSVDSCNVYCISIAGGLCGYVSDGSVTESYVTNSIIGSGVYSNSYCGGFIGMLGSSPTIGNCYASDNTVSSNVSSITAESFIGYIDSTDGTSTVEECYVKAEESSWIGISSNTVLTMTNFYAFSSSSWNSVAISDGAINLTTLGSDTNATISSSLGSLWSYDASGNTNSGYPYLLYNPPK